MYSMQADWSVRDYHFNLVDATLEDPEAVPLDMVSGLFLIISQAGIPKEVLFKHVQYTTRYFINCW